MSRDQAEGVRLAYVAATRARDVLVVPAVGDAPWEGGWLEPLNRALYPTPEARQSPAAAPKCPPLTSKDSVLTRPDDRLRDARTVAPGLHAFDGYSVVWCDPRWLLPIDVPPAIGVRRQELITKEVPRDIVDARRRTYEVWKADRASAREKGGRPSMSVLTARALAASCADDPAPSIPVVEVADRTGASRGAAFGVLVHAVLADVPLDASSRVITELARQHARVLGAQEDDIAAAVARVSAALKHELFARARRAAANGRCRRETPVVDRLEDGRLVEGIVDLAFEEDGIWTIVDYKTDRELTPEAEAEYRRQVASYVVAIGHATGAQARGIVLRV